MTWTDPASMKSIEERLAQRLGRIHARQRLGIEDDHESQVFGQGLNFFHIENWYSIHSVIRMSFRLVGLYARGRRNAADVRLTVNRISSARLPASFHGYRLLQLSDLHADMNEAAIQCAGEIVSSLEYDASVITGDFRGQTFGPFEACLQGTASLISRLKGDVYGVLGNHDTIRMLPGLEDLGIRMLLNECEFIQRSRERICLAGIDDAHFYRVDNIEKAAADISDQDFAILLSHTPEIFRQAAHAGFDVLLAGHTHGGQVCLPGGIPITLDAALPRAYGSGPWNYHGMTGYTSVGTGSSIVPVRLNCRPEITLHELYRL